MPEQNDFYVGYADTAPPGVAAFIKKMTSALIVAVLLLGAILLLFQSPFAPSVFEFGTYRTFRGTIIEKPYPMLLLDRPGLTEESPQVSLYLLTTFGKFGASERVAGLEGKRVELTGSLIYRDGQTMIEVQEDDIDILGERTEPMAEKLSAALHLPPQQKRTLRGEIVDSKCFYGVMKPGHLKPHKACAIRCISGGIPPVLVVKGAAGIADYFLLTGKNGEAANRQVLGMIAEPVEIRGEVQSFGNLQILRADPEDYRLIP